MASLTARVWRAFTEAEAGTHPDHPDRRLRGRTYAIPFDTVWAAALRISATELSDWRVIEADDRVGVIRIQARSPFLGGIDDVVVRVRLDPDAQTRVDARSTSRTARGDLGANSRRLRRFFRRLDDRLRGA